MSCGLGVSGADRLPADVLALVYSFLHPHFASRLNGVIDTLCKEILSSATTPEDANRLLPPALVDFFLKHTDSLGSYVLQPHWFALSSVSYLRSLRSSAGFHRIQRHDRASILAKLGLHVSDDEEALIDAHWGKDPDMPVTLMAAVQDSTAPPSDGRQSKWKAKDHLFSSLDQRGNLKDDTTPATKIDDKDVVDSSITLHQFPPTHNFRLVSRTWYEASEHFLSLRQHQLFRDLLDPTIASWKVLRQYRETCCVQNPCTIMSRRDFNQLLPRKEGPYSQEPDGHSFDTPFDACSQNMVASAATLWVQCCCPAAEPSSRFFNSSSPHSVANLHHEMYEWVQESMWFLGEHYLNAEISRELWQPEPIQAQNKNEVATNDGTQEMNLVALQASLPRLVKEALHQLRLFKDESTTATPAEETVGKFNAFATIKDFQTTTLATMSTVVDATDGELCTDLVRGFYVDHSDSQQNAISTTSIMRALAEEVAMVIRPHEEVLAIGGAKNAAYFKQLKKTHPFEQQCRSFAISEWAQAMCVAHPVTMAREMWRTKALDLARSVLAQMICHLNVKERQGYSQRTFPITPYDSACSPLGYKLSLEHGCSAFSGDKHHRATLVPNFESRALQQHSKRRHTHTSGPEEKRNSITLLPFVNPFLKSGTDQLNDGNAASSRAALDNVIKFVVIRGDVADGVTVEKQLRILLLGESVTAREDEGKGAHWSSNVCASATGTSPAYETAFHVEFSAAELHRFWLLPSLSTITPLLIRFGHRQILHDLLGFTAMGEQQPQQEHIPTRGFPGYMRWLFKPSLHLDTGPNQDTCSSSQCKRATIGFSNHTGFLLDDGFFASSRSRRKLQQLVDFLLCEVLHVTAEECNRQQVPLCVQHLYFSLSQMIIDLIFRREVSLADAMLVKLQHHCDAMNLQLKESHNISFTDDVVDIYLKVFAFPCDVEVLVRSGRHTMFGDLKLRLPEHLHILSAIAISVLKHQEKHFALPSLSEDVKRALHRFGAYKSGGVRWRKVLYVLHGAMATSSVLREAAGRDGEFVDQVLSCTSTDGMTRSERRFIDDLQFCFLN